jgi:hypothetical protein
MAALALAELISLAPCHAFIKMQYKCQ